VAQGKITVSNFSEQPMLVHIFGAVASGALVGSGVLAAAQSSGFLVSGYNEYRVNFLTTDRGPVTVTNIVPDAIVQLEINGS
jgi:hypothetical protein